MIYTFIFNNRVGIKKSNVSNGCWGDVFHILAGELLSPDTVACTVS